MGADSAPSAPDLPAKGTNQRSLPSQKAGPAPGTAGSRLGEKQASGREAVRNGGAGDSGANGDNEEDEEVDQTAQRPGRRNKDTPATLLEKRGTLMYVPVTGKKGTRGLGKTGGGRIIRNKGEWVEVKRREKE
ncbi:hypothetical protein NDU88_002261 [Pleurodeles waltl]|uniref:Uncharacterized protein n=1 Tax=Pleurodeles waltl TaxID=8319 RepID=A0AAV7SEB7_PLEWA|nr:hypothetical protein NDU88_002261 [Pleurodeles waltl]